MIFDVVATVIVLGLIVALLWPLRRVMGRKK